MTAKPVTLPALTEHPPFAELVAKQGKLSAELDELTRERAALGDCGPPLSQIELDALRLSTPKSDPGAVRAMKGAEKAHALDYRIEVLTRALDLLEGQLPAARDSASRALAPRAFAETYRPAVKKAGEQLLSAVKAMWGVRKVLDQIAIADLDRGPCKGGALPLFLLDSHLEPSRIISALADNGFISAAEAEELRKKYAA